MAWKVAKVLELSGYRTGLFVSPHVSCFRERVLVNGAMIPEAAVESLLPQLFDLCETEAIPATFFEYVTALAMMHFRDAGVDVAVFECGLGGRLDSTNIFSAPLVTAITSIGLDHQQFLGPDLRSIAGEKAGILKEGVPCVLGILPPEARSVVLERSMRLGVEVQDGLPDPAETTGPEWLARNRAVARRILRLLPGDAAADEAVLRAGPAAWGLRGRWQFWDEDCLLDCAHNVEGLTAAGKALQALGRPIRLVYAAVADKDVAEALSCLPETAHNHWCAAEVPRAMPVAELAALASSAGRTGSVHDSVADAVVAARSRRTGQELVVVLGSVFTVGEALTALEAG